ncbi:Hemolysins and related protein containing CBS domain [Bacillus cereus]|uniref:Hemolysins and related protein containing CBS domain n=2 Tax=Bacillus cereus TaxID=1396 RepID=A0A164QD52_BACCE|nr:Hemolysins and related protein containing CBS domain [Bacillus cereus]
MGSMSLLIVLLCIVITAFFVISEFSLIKVRPSRIDQLVDEGVSKAKRTKSIIDNLDGYLSACQLGITVASLALGWVGEPAVHKLLHPLFSVLPDSAERTVSFIVSFLIVTFLHVILGELAPKSIAIRYAERLALWTSVPLVVFYHIMYPMIWILNACSNGILKVFRIPPASENEDIHSEEEIRLLMKESYKNGELNPVDYKYVKNIFEFRDKVAGDVMTPRIQMIVIDHDATISEAMDIIKKEQYTRYPIIDGDKDHIIGMVHLKDVVSHYVDTESRTKSIQTCMRDIGHSLRSARVNELFLKMQHERCQMTLLIDEYGGTSGMVTMEDLLEEIVGEIRDEFDQEELTNIEHLQINPIHQ